VSPIDASHRRRRPRKVRPFVIDTLELTDPRHDEVLVRVAASGMCATDLHGRDAGHRNIMHAVRYTELRSDRFDGFWKD
jgi:threonine dehydrogenase-like Zn-dependent dehydrogenase